MCFHHVPKNMCVCVFVYSWEGKRGRRREQKGCWKQSKEIKTALGGAKYVSTANILEYNRKAIQLDIYLLRVTNIHWKGCEFHPVSSQPLSARLYWGAGQEKAQMGSPGQVLIGAEWGAQSCPKPPQKGMDSGLHQNRPHQKGKIISHFKGKENRAMCHLIYITLEWRL